MHFHKKLDLLMNTLNITNSCLARALSIDPSLVSRWRTGARKPSQKADYLKKIANYISSYSKMDYQKAAIYEMIGLTNDKSQKYLYSLAEYLYIWLKGDKTANEVFVEKFFNSISQKQSSSLNNNIKINDPKVESIKQDLEILNGISGKREGVIKFLEAVLASKEKTTLLLYSNEDMEWLTEDKEFYRKWGILLKNIIARGHKIKIIHTIKREMSEMLAAIEYWMPLYLTGAIEPYYYPKYQENIFRRTIFVAPGISALSCSTVSEYGDKAQQFLYWDPEKIKDLAEEFNTLLGSCRSLMKIFTGEETYNFKQLQIEFEEQEGEFISITDMPSFITMPEQLLNKYLEINDLDDNQKKFVLSIYYQRNTAFKSNLKSHIYNEIMALPNKEKLISKEKSNKVVDFFSDIDFNYTLQDYCDHLKYQINLLKNYKNYHLFLISSFPYENIKLAVKDEVGAVISRNDDQSIILAFNQPNMTNSFYTYLNNIIRTIPDKEKNKVQIINRLNNFIDELLT